MTAMIELSSLTRTFGSNLVLPSLSLEIERGETVAIMGPSGVGKTTLLRCIAGLDRQFGGSIRIAGTACADYWRTGRAAMMFQHYTNFHWMTVRQNLAEARRHAEAPHGLVEAGEINKVLTAVGLSDSHARYIASLSGGMQQRVALARVILQDSEIVMLDEPFGALDVATRAALQDFTRREFASEDKTVLFVTHDPVEALYVSNRVLILDRDGQHRLLASPGTGEAGQHVKSAKSFVDAQAELVDTLMTLRGA